MAAKEKTLLKVTGILLLVVASISFLFALLVLVTGSRVFMRGGEDGEILVRTIKYLLLAGSAFLSSAVNLTAGIFGVKYAAHPEKANRCLVAGIVAAALNVLLFFGNLINLNGFVMPLGNLLLLPLMICYLVGAAMNRPGKGIPAEGN